MARKDSYWEAVPNPGDNKWKIGGGQRSVTKSRRQHGGTGANQYTVKDEKSKEGNSLSANKPKDGGAKSPSRIIARLKRDATTDPKAEALLGSIEAGDIKPYRAAVEMGWVKPPDLLATFLRYFSKQDRKARASIIQIILDCHGKD